MTTDFRHHGFIRVATATPQLSLADPSANANTMMETLEATRAAGASLLLFPELAITGYSCEDLFHTDMLLAACRDALLVLARASTGITVVVGTPWVLADGRLINAAAVLAGGRIAGLVPKSCHPNYGEFYEQRWFVSGSGIDETVTDTMLGTFRISRRQLFSQDGCTFGIEICEDLWSPDPPSTSAALAGAEIILNPSASNELVGKAEYRSDLVRMTSARTISAYVYAGSGPLESTKDTVFGGHRLIAENGVTLLNSPRFGFESAHAVVDIDLLRLRYERRRNTTFAQTVRPQNFERVLLPDVSRPITSLSRHIPAWPFVPEDAEQFARRAAEIIAIQSTGLARRMLASRAKTLVIGLSGGLDSTLAYLVCLETLKRLKQPVSALHALTLPGPGTSQHTFDSVLELARCTGVAVREIPIHDAVRDHLQALGHSAEDVVFENAQARERTQILFNYANQQGGIVVGTGDLSELALGWCTFNADHMANYNVNASVPKTMIAYLVRWYAQHRADAALAAVLERILATPISPELLPTKDGEIAQRTEDLIGPYALHDFFLYQLLRTGAGPARMLALATQAFAGTYEREFIRKWLRVFVQRFFTQQFKRTTLPPGPKVGTVSLSPRGDWRMPDEAMVERWLEQIDSL
ncbi:MAG: NAD(+) synthase [Gammaproteobacteria bacterium]|nr:NAD(+) synthase [Gammaproteobacteria bacterium]